MNSRGRKLLQRLLQQNPHYGTGDDLDVGVWDGSVRCHQIDTIFWRYRGRKRLPARAMRQIHRAIIRYRRISEARYLTKRIEQ